ncbi:polynucleotide kinase-phosphatase [Ruminococcus sp. HUN007]|uniref:polynucleotide kinase-phosphatase n=1 Tax=Ruminococcus sp. HUN007 TaxID=1514668 RepID=UPI0005D1B02A|nr:polynucleotide kinase-phosphatase [Ruminococcus sp. HUN007]
MDKFKIEIPEFCLVALVGGTSSGKTTFAGTHFRPTEILSSDFFRGMVCDNESSQNVSEDAFDLLYYAAKKRLEHMRLTVIDATNILQSARKRVLDLAREHDVHAAAIVLDLPEDLIQERNKARPDRGFSERVIRNHCRDVKRSIRYLKKEGFRFVYVIDSLEKLENTEIVRTKLWNDKKEMHGPFDIIGDIHGCFDELELLLEKLGYTKTDGIYSHPEGRKAAFLGDFCDRGNRNADVLRLVMDMVKSENAIAVPGNHDVKLLKYLRGKNIARTHGIDKTIADIEGMGDDFKNEAAGFIDSLISHYVLDDGKLVIAHAGLKQEYISRASARVRDFCIYGETTGETDTFGLPVRLDWTADYRGDAAVVYGHIAGREVRAQNNTYCIDTGCVYGGKLTAYRYPEKEFVSVDALEQYYEPVKPLEEKQEEDIGDMLTVGDFNKKLHVETELMPSIDIHENNAAAALEIMSRFAADPHWLIYLPPTMSPCETSGLDGYLEHPLEAFEYYKSRGIRNVVCEKKHMGSRAVIVLCRNAETAAGMFGITDGSRGIIYTRTGRKFFDRGNAETELLDRLDTVLTESAFWDDFKTDWVCLDTELMPWSEKAQGLIRSQYAPAGNAGAGSLKAAVSVLEKACIRQKDNGDQANEQDVDLSDILERYRSKQDDIDKYIKAYREYCWTVNSTDDIRIAPFHILAVEGHVFSEEKHVWHMENIRKYITGKDPVYMETPYICVDTEDENSVKNGVNWWLDLTGNGSEGMVVKPETFTAKQGHRLLQPAVKCRGREYLRIIYGAEYLEPDHLKRLKVRSLNRKRTLALKEFSLGMESLNRFVRKEPLYRVHECSFGVLAFESEPVDPRL